MNRKILIFMALIGLILCTGFAFAEDVPSNETVGIAENCNDLMDSENAAEQVVAQEYEPLCSGEGSGTFSDLNSEIRSSSEIMLSRNYNFTSRYDSSLRDGIVIDREVTINGNNFVIDGNGISTIFDIRSTGKLTLNDVYIINTFTGDTSIITNRGELTLDNVFFTSHRSISRADGGIFRDIYNVGSLTISDSHFINSTFDVISSQTSNLNNLNIRGFIDNIGTISISNTVFDNNIFKPKNQFGRSHEISTVLFNNASGSRIVLNNISVTNNDVSYTSSAQEVFNGFIRNQNGNLIINNSLFENNTALFPNSNSQRLGILYSNGETLTIQNSVFKTNEFNDAIITSDANNAEIVKNVFDSNAVTKNVINNKGSGQLNVTHNIFLNNVIKTSSSRMISSSSTFLLKADENYWGTNDPDLRNLASISYTPTYIVLNVTGPREVVDKETVYTIALNKLDNGNNISDDALYDYYIDVQSNNLGTTTPVAIENGIGHYIYEPIDKGEDILSIGSIRLRVNVTTIFLTASIEIITEYTDTAFAGTNNSIIARVFVNRDFGVYKIKFFADGVELSETIQDLSRTPKELIFLDDNVRPIDETTVAGADNPKVNYTVEVYGNDELIGKTTLVVPLLYNGYLGKDFGYPINDMEFDYNATINGDILIQLQDDMTYMGASTTEREFEWRTVLSSDSEYVAGFLYVPYNWDKTTSGPYPEFNLIFNGNDIKGKVIGKYRDQANVGRYGPLGYGVLIYDVGDYLQNGRNTLKLEKENGLTAVYPPTLVTLFNKTESDSLKTVFIKNGADLLYNSYNLAGRPIQSTTEFTVPDLANMTKATWYVFAAGASSDEADVKFNGNIYRNVWENSTGTNYHAAFIADVTQIIGSTNQASFISTGETILSLQNILIISHPLVKERTKINLATEYAGAAYAGTNNTITADIKMNKSGRYDIILLADGNVVCNISQDLTTEWTRFYLTDSTIRPVDETTVSGASNKKINYTLEIFRGEDGVANSTIAVSLLYNGYLGKEYAYPNEDMIFNYTNAVTGDIIIQIQEDNTYLGLEQTNRIDNWEINLPENSNIVNGFIYISYNWDKTSSGDCPELSLVFNGRNIQNKLVGKYRDQSNLGTSGRYGYGLLIYDVSDLIYNGQNSLILKKEKGLSAIYPSSLIAIYNVTGKDGIKNIVINNGADLLYNAYNLANRSVKSVNMIEFAPLNKTTLYVFASSANNGDMDLKVNGNVYSNIWENYESTYHNGVFEIDMTGIARTSNAVEFISTGGTVLALHQIIVTSAGHNDSNVKPTPQPNPQKDTNKKTKTKKTAPKLTSKKKTYKVKAKKKKISATLKNKKGKAIVGVQVTFKVKGKVYKAKTNKKGTATVNVKLNKKGKYAVTVKFAGNKLYTAKSIKTMLIIKK